MTAPNDGFGEVGTLGPRPDFDACERRETLTDVPGDGYQDVALIHPQWGGYCSPCRVRVYTGGCFDVENWHDGEFPRDDESTVLHYCMAEQVVLFGVSVLERVAAISERVEDALINDAIERLIKIRDRGVTP